MKHRRSNILSGAIFDKSRRYRYLLWRRLGKKNDNFVNFVLLNPSTADEKKDDPTIKACIKFAQNYGYDGIFIMNLFAYRATKPSILRKIKDPIGIENDKYLKKYARMSKTAVVAWGNNGTFKNRDKEALKILRKIKENIYCLGITNAGNPRHPLYVRRSIELKHF